MEENRGVTIAENGEVFATDSNQFYCDLCCEHLNYRQNFSRILTMRVFSRFGYLSPPSSQGWPLDNPSSSSLLQEQVVLYFIGKKLLNLRDDQFLELLTNFNSDKHGMKEDNLNKKEEEYHYGRGYYFDNFCGKCEDIISTALVMHQKLVELQRKTVELGFNLETAIRSGAKRTSNLLIRDQSNTITKKLQEFVVGDLGFLSGQAESNAGDNGETIPVKVEVDDQGQYGDDKNEDDVEFNAAFENSFEDHFDSSPNHHQDNEDDNNGGKYDNGTGTSRTSEKKIKPFHRKRKRRKLRSGSDERDSNDSDFDYQPEAENSATPKKGKINAAKKSSLKAEMSRFNVKSNKVSKSLTQVTFERNQTNFTCDLCSMVLTTPNSVKHHRKMHEESSRMYKNKYDCPHCKYPALSERKLRYHLTKIHQATQKNTCSVCGYVGSRRNIYEKHMQEKHNIQVWQPIDELNDDDKVNSTNLVDQSNPVNLEDNKTNDTKDQGKIYRCKICNYGYKILRSLQRHKHDHKISKEQNHKFDCDECKFPANSEKFLRYHMMKDHKKILLHTCNLCGHQVKRLFELKAHMKSKHAEKLDAKEDVSRVNEVSNTAKAEHNTATFTKTSVCLNEKFKCDKCSTVYKTINGYRIHQNDHDTSEEQNHKYDCKICKFPANSEIFLRYHMIRLHKQHLLRTCSLCGHQVKRLSQLKLHMKNQHGQTLAYRKKEKKACFKSRWFNNRKCGKFHCLLCKYAYSDSGSLKRHMDEHSKNEELNRQWECNRCTFPCTSEERLRRHILRYHEKIKPTCTICQKTFGRPYLLREHMAMHKKYDRFLDPTTGTFPCRICSNTFPSGKSLSLHVAQRHRNENHITGEPDDAVDPTFPCTHCGRYFENSVQLRRHQRIKHQATNRYICDICGKGMDAKGKMERHRKSHEANKVRDFVCEICGSAYTERKTLMKHLKKFHPTGEGISNKTTVSNKIYRCKFCQLEFPFKILYEKHLSSSHQDMYTFQCDLCEKSYISASSLRLHKEIGHREGLDSKNNSNTCQYCGKTFVHKHYVVCHYKFCSAKRDLEHVN